MRLQEKDGIRNGEPRCDCTRGAIAALLQEAGATSAELTAFAAFLNHSAAQRPAPGFNSVSFSVTDSILERE